MQEWVQKVHLCLHTHKHGAEADTGQAGAHRTCHQVVSAEETNKAGEGEKSQEGKDAEGKETLKSGR